MGLQPLADALEVEAEKPAAEVGGDDLLHFPGTDMIDPTVDADQRDGHVELVVEQMYSPGATGQYADAERRHRDADEQPVAARRGLTPRRDRLFHPPPGAVVHCRPPARVPARMRTTSSPKSMSSAC